MIWTFKVTEDCKKQFNKLDKPIQKRILSYFHHKVLPHPNPVQLAKPLKGPFAPYHRYRIGDHRMIVDIRKPELVIIGIHVSHRKNIYS
jgi:mRNA interferase RelE/StbE